MIAGCYVMHAYCEVCNARAETLGSVQTRGQAAKQIRERGWYINCRVALCKEHNTKENRTKLQQEGKAH